MQSYCPSQRCGIRFPEFPRQRYPYTYCVGSRTTLAACYNCRSSSVCRVPLSPKWATPGLGSDFAISPYVVVCNPSITLYLFDPCDSDTGAVITNPHTSNALSTTARRAPPTATSPLRSKSLSLSLSLSLYIYICLYVYVYIYI